MIQKRARKIPVALLGLVFSSAVYLLVTSVREGWQAQKEGALPMMLSLYVTLGIFLLVAACHPSANPSVIAFASSFAHGAVMTVMSVHLPNEPSGLLVGTAVFAAIGAMLIVLAPQSS